VEHEVDREFASKRGPKTLGAAIAAAHYGGEDCGEEALIRM